MSTSVSKCEISNSDVILTMGTDLDSVDFYVEILNSDVYLPTSFDMEGYLESFGETI